MNFGNPRLCRWKYRVKNACLSIGRSASSTSDSAGLYRLKRKSLRPFTGSGAADADEKICPCFYKMPPVKSPSGVHDESNQGTERKTRSVPWLLLNPCIYVPAAVGSMALSESKNGSVCIFVPGGVSFGEPIVRGPRWRGCRCACVVPICGRIVQTELPMCAVVLLRSDFAPEPQFAVSFFRMASSSGKYFFTATGCPSALMKQWDDAAVKTIVPSALVMV